MKKNQPENENSQEAPSTDTNQIIEERRAKLATLREQGNAFPNDFRRQHLAADLQAGHGEKTNEELEASPVRVVVAGRMLLKRVMADWTTNLQDVAVITDTEAGDGTQSLQLNVGAVVDLRKGS